MSLKKIEQVKKDKWFSLWDLLVYGAIILFVAALFIIFAIFIKAYPLTEIEVYYDNNVIFTYTFEGEKEESYNIIDSSKIKILEDNKTELKLLFFLNEDESDYNEILINKQEVWVKVTNADCSMRKDCVYSQKITDTTGVIFCTPHKLTVRSAEYVVSDPSDIVIG